MKVKIISISLIFLLSLFGQKENNRYRKVKNTSFEVGEKLEYRVHLGFLSGATASMEISDKIYQLNNRPCYKINVFGKTAGMIDFFYKVRDNWGSYIDTAAIIPHRSYRYIRENKYRKNEIVDFDHLADTVTVARLEKDGHKVQEKVKFAVDDNIQDIVSGYYYLRTMDLKKLKRGDIIQIKGFFDDEIYNIKIKYLGTDDLKTKVGTFNCHVMTPLLPENKLFSEEESIKIWISNDTHKIPLKIKAEMFVGSIEVDIKSYENLR